MKTSVFGRSYGRFYAWLLNLGIPRALVLMTTIATTTSLGLTMLLMELVNAPDDLFWYAMLVGALSPLLTAPLLSLAAVFMVFQLNAAKTALTMAADTDALTGVANRRSFMVRAELAFANARATGAPFSVVMLDIDHFKAINDAHGHSAGDDVLREVARACRDSLRASDCFARFGGEEFICLLEVTNTDGAAAVAEILRKTVASLSFEDRTPPSVTVSLGVAGYLARSESLHDILNEADRQLYAAKAAGRNRVMVADGVARIAS